MAKPDIEGIIKQILKNPTFDSDLVFTVNFEEKEVRVKIEDEVSLMYYFLKRLDEQGVASRTEIKRQYFVDFFEAFLKKHPDVKKHRKDPDQALTYARTWYYRMDNDFLKAERDGMIWVYYMPDILAAEKNFFERTSEIDKTFLDDPNLCLKTDKKRAIIKLPGYEEAVSAILGKKDIKAKYDSLAENRSQVDAVYLFMRELITLLNTDKRNEESFLEDMPHLKEQIAGGAGIVFSVYDCLKIFDAVKIEAPNAFSAVTNSRRTLLGNTTGQKIDDLYTGFQIYNKFWISIPDMETLESAYRSMRINRKDKELKGQRKEQIAKLADPQINKDYVDFILKYLSNRVPAGLREITNEIAISNPDVKELEVLEAIKSLEGKSIRKSYLGTFVSIDMEHPSQVLKFAYFSKKYEPVVNPDIYFFALVTMAERSAIEKTEYNLEKLLLIYHERDAGVTGAQAGIMIKGMKEAGLITGNEKKFTLTKKGIEGYNHALRNYQTGGKAAMAAVEEDIPGPMVFTADDQAALRLLRKSGL